MNEESPGRIRLSIDEARALSLQALARIGYDAEESRILAEHMLDAALCGYEYSGLPKILNVAEHRRLKLPRRVMRAVHETPVSAMFDGGNLRSAAMMLPSGPARMIRLKNRSRNTPRFA